MGLLNKIGKIIKAPIKVLEKVISPVSMIPGVGKVLEKVVSPVSMIPGTAGKVLGGIAGITPLKGAIAGISPGGVKGAIAGITPLAKPIVSAVNKAKGSTVKMAKGGSASSRADGIAQRGKTRGRMV